MTAAKASPSPAIRAVLRPLAIGWRAADCFARPDACGVVRGVVSEAIYLATQSGTMYWLIGRHVPMHARAVRLESLPAETRTGDPWTASSGRLEVAGGVADLQETPIWDLRESGRGQAGSWKGIGERAIQIFGPGKPDSSSLEPIASGRSWTAEVLRGLIGRGPGLTPAGDDFLGGLLFAQHHLEAAYPGVGRRLSTDDLLAGAEQRTPALSLTLLRDMAVGEGLQPLHELMDCLLGRQPPHTGRIARQRLTALGASTGHELTAGLLEGLRWWMEGAGPGRVRETIGH